MLIADDDAVFRAAVSALIRSRQELALVGAAADADEAIALSASLRPDLALLDYKMPGGGAHAAKEIINASRSTAVVCLTAYDDPATERLMYDAGARHFLVKGACSIDDIVTAIVTAGQSREAG